MQKQFSIVLVPDKVDVKTAGELEEKLEASLQSGVINLICDFSANEYVSSAGLRVFLSILKKTARREGKLVLCAMRPGVKEVFDMVGFSSLFEICESQQEAAQAIEAFQNEAEKKLLARTLRDGQKDAAAANYEANNKTKVNLDEKI